MATVRLDVGERLAKAGRHLAVLVVEHDLGEPEDRVEGRAQLVAHVGEELRFGLTRLRQALVEAAELLRRHLLLVVEAAELVTHPVHVLGERAELIPIGHDDRPPESPLRYLAQEAVSFLHGQDERPRDHDAPHQRDHDGHDGEAAHQSQRVPVAVRDTPPEAGHARLLGGDELAHQLLDAPVGRLLAGPQRRHRVRESSVADGVDAVGDGRHRVLLRAANGLDERAFLGPRHRLETRERVVEPVVLAHDQADRGVVPGEESHGAEVHLHRERLLDLPRPVDVLVRLIEAIHRAGRRGEGLEAHRAHRDEQESDEKETRQKLHVDGGAHPRHRPHEGAQRRGQQPPSEL